MNILKLELTDEQKNIIKECEESIKKYNQAAVLLSMGGGKSVIAAHLIRRLKGNNTKFKVLWITTANDVKKAESIMSIPYLSESLTYVNFNKLQREHNYADILKQQYIKFDLIVIDEAHHALATQTYKGLSNILNKYKGAKLLVMTATKRRYSDRKLVFKELTPKLTLNQDYKDRGLKNAVDNGLTCDFVYKTCNIQLLRDYCNIIEELKRYSVIYTKYDKLIEQSKKIIDDYSNNTFTRLGENIRNDLEFDGSEGDRWFVFYYRIKDIENNLDNIKKTFEIAYNNPNVEINLIEFHSEANDDKALAQILSEPVKNRVDIIITCNKGAESLHPANTRGIVMLRKTMSSTVFEQMLGRVLEIKEKCDYVKYIYDCVDNRTNVEKGETIYNGLDKPDDRRIASIIKKVNTNDNIIENLQKKYGDSFDIEIMDADMADVIESFNNIKDLYEDISNAYKVHAVLCNRTPGGEEYNNLIKHGVFSPKSILSRYDAEEGTKLAQIFYSIQKKFINGTYGEHFVDDDREDDVYYMLYDMFGDLLYVTGDKPGAIDMKFEEIIKIALEVRKYNFDYRNSISKTKELKHKIARLRAYNLRGDLSEAYQVFCKRNKIDINGIYSNLIKEVLDTEESKRFTNITNEFKQLARELSSVKSLLEVYGYSINDIEENDLRDRLLTVIAKEHIFTLHYSNNDYGVQASTALNITYRKVLNLARKLINKDDYIKASLIINSLRKINIFSGKNNDTEAILKNISIDVEYPIIDLVKRNEYNDISIYEEYVLECLDIKVIDNVRRNTNIRKLIDKTPFGITYNRFIETSSEQDFNKLSTYKKEGLPEYAKKLLETRAYKHGKNIVEKEKLLSKENKEIQDIIKEMYYIDEDSITTIRKAVKNKEIDNRKLLKYAIPYNTYMKNKNFFDKALVTPWEQLDELTIKNIVRSLTECVTCYDCIIENLLEANLIPEEQLRLANELIKIANQ